jgi:hypothetical protein
LRNGAGEFVVSRTNEFLFATVNESVICDAVMSMRSDAAGVDGIPLSFLKLLLPVVLPVLTHIFNHKFVSSEFLGSGRLLWCCRCRWSVARPNFLITDHSVFLFVQSFAKHSGSCVEGDRRHSAEHGGWTDHGVATLGFFTGVCYGGALGCCCAICEMPKIIQLVLVCWWGHISVN